MLYLKIDNAFIFKYKNTPTNLNRHGTLNRKMGNGHEQAIHRMKNMNSRNVYEDSTLLESEKCRIKTNITYDSIHALFPKVKKQINIVWWQKIQWERNCKYYWWEVNSAALLGRDLSHKVCVWLLPQPLHFWV